MSRRRYAVRRQRLVAGSRDAEDVLKIASVYCAVLLVSRKNSSDDQGEVVAFDTSGMRRWAAPNGAVDRDPPAPAIGPDGNVYAIALQPGLPAPLYSFELGEVPDRPAQLTSFTLDGGLRWQTKTSGAHQLAITARDRWLSGCSIR
jgi:hypothetical protein